MIVRERVRIAILAEKLQQDKAYADRIGVSVVNAKDSHTQEAQKEVTNN